MTGGAARPVRPPRPAAGAGPGFRAGPRREHTPARAAGSGPGLLAGPGPASCEGAGRGHSPVLFIAGWPVRHRRGGPGASLLSCGPAGLADPGWRPVPDPGQAGRAEYPGPQLSVSYRPASGPPGVLPGEGRFRSGGAGNGTVIGPCL
jgi:hypothetical protein